MSRDRTAELITEITEGLEVFHTMHWLGLYFPDLPLEVLVRGQPLQGPLAVTARQGGQLRILRCNEAAQRQGIRPGQPLQAALALAEGLRSWPRDPAREEEALQGLAQWAWQFSSLITFEPSLLLLEIGASLRLFGGIDALLRRILEELPRLGYNGRWAMAPSPMAAGLLARELPGSRITTREALLAPLGEIPLARWTRDPEARALLNDIGLASIGDALGLPRAELARRLGPGLLQLLDRLVGDAPDPRPSWQPPPRFEEAIELPAEVENVAALVFPARRLLLSLSGFLRGRDAVTQRLHWRLEYREAMPPNRVEQGLLRPSRDPEHLLARFRERLERVMLEAPVIRLGLRVDDCLPYAECSKDWLNGTGAEAGKDILERLATRLGAQRLASLRGRPDYRPEQAVAIAPMEEGGGQPLLRGSLPVWLLHPPRPLKMTGGVPQHGGPLELLRHSQRIESGWWDGEDAARDYYLARNPAGERVWVFRDRRNGRWFLHGLFD